MLLRMGLLLRLGPNVITDRTFITLGFKMLLRMGLLLGLGPNVITDRTFITLGFKMLLRMGLLLGLGPNVITDGTFITLGSSYYTCAFNTSSSLVSYTAVLCRPSCNSTTQEKLHKSILSPYFSSRILHILFLLPN